MIFIQPVDRDVEVLTFLYIDRFIYRGVGQGGILKLLNTRVYLDVVQIVGVRPKRIQIYFVRQDDDIVFGAILDVGRFGPLGEREIRNIF